MGINAPGRRGMLAGITPVITSGGRAMSEFGDCVWADGRAWTRFSGLSWQRHDRYLISEEWRNEKRWWVRPSLGSIAAQTLANLKEHDDFAWLVKDGIPIVLNALAVYHALDSFADFVARRDAGAELTAERDALLSRLADVREELEPWGLERLTGRDRTLAEQVHDIRQSWTALRDANRHNMSRLDVVEQQLATAHAEHEKLLTDLARACEERDAAEAKGYSHGLLVERAAVVRVLRNRFQYRYAAEIIEAGMHLAGDDV